METYYDDDGRECQRLTPEELAAQGLNGSGEPESAVTPPEPVAVEGNDNASRT